MRGFFVGLRGYFVDMEGPVLALEGTPLQSIIYVDPFRPKRAICRCGRASAALRVPLTVYSLSEPSFSPREHSVGVGGPVLPESLVDLCGS